MRISDWSSDVCSSDLILPRAGGDAPRLPPRRVRPGAAGRGRGSWNKRPNNGVMAQILLADDAASIREFLAQAPSNAGHHLVAAGGGLDATSYPHCFRHALQLATAVTTGLHARQL